MADTLDSGGSLADVALRLGLVVLVIVLTWLAQRLVHVLLLRVIKALLLATNVIRGFEPALEEQFCQRLTHPVRLFTITLGIRFALLFVELSPELRHTVDNLVLTVVIVVAFWAFFQITGFASQHYIQQAAAGKTRFDETIVRFVRQVINALIIVLGLVVVLEWWGINVGAFVAGLGVR